MAPPIHRSSRSRSLSLALALALAALTPACPSSGGDDGGDDPGNGGVGVGADGVTIFWWGYGGDRFGWGAQVRPLEDGSYIAAGSRSRVDFTFDPTTFDAYLLKVDSRGKLLWERDLGQDGLRESAHDVVPMASGGFLVVGEAARSQANPVEDMLLACTDADGLTLWDRRRGEDGFDSARAALEVPGGFLVAGACDVAGDLAVGRQAALIHVDQDGLPVWERYYGEEGFDEAWALAAGTGGGYALAGFKSGTPPLPVDQVWLIRTDASGDEVWARSYGEGHAYGVTATDDDGFVLTGFVLDESDGLDLVVLRVDSDGNELWRRVLGGGDDDWGREVTPRPGGGFLVAGTAQSFTAGSEPWSRQDVYLIALDEGGEVIFQKVKGKAPDSSELAESVVATPDGGMILCGSWAARLLLMKADKNGDTVWLGGEDVSLELPDVPQGLIGFADALPVAKAAVDLVFIARQVGPFATEHFTEVLAGTTPAQYCSGGGTFSVLPNPVPPLAGQTFQVVFGTCLTAAPDNLFLDGLYDFTFSTLIGDLQAPPYTLESLLTDIAFTVVDDSGTRSLGGYVTFDRSAASSNNHSDLTGLLGATNLVLTSNGVTYLSDQLVLESGLAGGKFQTGPASARLSCPAVPAWLEVAIPASDPLLGPDPFAPALGSLAVEAPDLSRLVLRALDNGKVQFELDTDGDGTVDLTFQTLWEALY